MRHDRTLLNGPRTFHWINNKATAVEMTRILGFTNVIQTSHPHAQKHFIGNAIENPRNDALKGLHNPAQGNAMGKFKTTFAV